MIQEEEEYSFTSTEELILDVLVAHYRLGSVWTFNSRHKIGLRKLRQKGLVTTLAGFNEDTVLGSLTDQALHEHGPRWFETSVTLDLLPAASAEESGITGWSKAHLEALIKLPHYPGHTDPRAINTAHLLMIRMISQRHPIHQVAAGANRGVVLRNGLRTVEISAEGRAFRLHRTGARGRETSQLQDVLSFTSCGRQLFESSLISS